MTEVISLLIDIKVILVIICILLVWISYEVHFSWNKRNK